MYWGVQMFPCFAMSTRVLRQIHCLHICGYSMLLFQNPLCLCTSCVFNFCFLKDHVSPASHKLLAYIVKLMGLWFFIWFVNLSILQNDNVSAHAVNVLFVRTAYEFLHAIILSCVQCSCMVPQDKSHLLCCGDVFSRSRVSSNPFKWTYKAKADNL